MYSRRGFRVIAIGCKKIEWNRIDTITRKQAQWQLEFNGFEIFENKLKAETYDTIQVLHNAKIGMSIITGDNINTASNIGFKSGLIQKDKTILICQLINLNNIKFTKLTYEEAMGY